MHSCLVLWVGVTPGKGEGLKLIRSAVPFLKCCTGTQDLRTASFLGANSQLIRLPRFAPSHAGALPGDSLEKACSPEELCVGLLRGAWLMISILGLPSSVLRSAYVMPMPRPVVERDFLVNGMLHHAEAVPKQSLDSSPSWR